MQTISQNHQNEINEKDLQILEMNEQIQKFKDREDIKAEVSKLTLQKDIQINNLEI